MEREVFSNGRKITYFEEGEGPPFLIIHGWSPRPIDDFLDFQKILAGKGYRVILLKLPGFNGDNGNGGEGLLGWGMRDYLNYILGFADCLGLDKFFLIGHSMGGAMAIELAVIRPERIKALILLSPGIIRPVKARFWKWWIFTIGINIFLTIIWLISIIFSFTLAVLKKIISCPISIIGFRRFVGRLIKELSSWGWGLYRQFLFRRDKTMYKVFKRIVAFENTILHLSKVNQPTIIFWGKKDYNYYLFGRSSIKRLPNCPIHVIPRVGHSIQKDAPEEVIELIVDFIKKQES